jgi:PleD family two-component response regulator
MRRRVLIIDDDTDSVLLLRFALERAGFEVIVSFSAEEALHVAAPDAPDCILLALEVGAQSGQAECGLELCRQLRASTRTGMLPLILVTSKLRSESDTVAGFKAGADDYVMKPFRPAEVVARVESLIERTQRSDSMSTLTGLPGFSALQMQLRRLIVSSQPFSVLYGDIDNFGTYNQVMSFERGNAVLRDVAQIFSKAVMEHAPGAFLSYAGEDEFVVAWKQEDLLEVSAAIIEAFNASLPSWYPPEILERGFVTLHDRRGGARDVPLISISLTGVNNAKRQFRNPLEIAAVAAETRRAIRDVPGSHYLQDRRSTREPRL